MIFQFLFGLRNVQVISAISYFFVGTSQMVQWVKNPPANPGDIGNMGSIPEPGRSPRV